MRIPAPAPDATFEPFLAAERAFTDAAAKAGTTAHSYRIAGLPITFRFAGDELTRRLTPALGHLESAPDSSGLTVFVWDAASTGTSFPLPAFEKPGEASRQFPVEAATRRALYQPTEGALTLFDPASRTAMYWVADAKRLPNYQNGGPFRLIINWWVSAHGFQLLHAGAVGTERGGVLLIGRGGSGKSTASLACLDSDLGFVGDDCQVVSVDPTPVAHSLYATAKVKGDHIRRFPRLAPAVWEPNASDAQDKTIVLVSRTHAASILHRMPIKALVSCSVAGDKPAFERIGAARALAALAPSSLIQIAGADASAFPAMARLVQKVPGFALRIGGDVALIPDAIRAILKEATA